jgi:phenylacetate-CoA ligase
MSATGLAVEDLLHPLLGKYLRGPGWLRTAAGAAYARLPKRVRLGAAYDDFRRAIAATRGASHAEAYASAKLAETLAWTLETVPAYRPWRHLLSQLSDPRAVLAQLPIADKLHIKHATEAYLSRGMPRSAALATFTGGSTSTPMRFFLQKHVTRPKEHAFVDDFRARVGADDGDVVLALRGRSIAGAERGEPLWAYEPIRRHLMLSCDHMEHRFMRAHARVLAQWRPTYIEAFPSALYPLATWLETHPLPQFTRNLKGVMLFSENAYGFQMEKFRRVFGCPVVAHYGHSERALMAATQPHDERYFFWPQYGWLELVDAQDRPITEPGRLGYVVGTSFDNRVMPFVRYRTGDLAMLGEREDPRLPGHRVLERIAGRLQEFVRCADGRLVSITTLGTAHFPELCALEAIQYEQERAGEVRLHVVSAERLDPRVARRIARAVEEKLQGGCRVAVARVPHIERTPRGKARMLVQHLDLRRELHAHLTA